MQNVWEEVYTICLNEQNDMQRGMQNIEQNPVECNTPKRTIRKAHSNINELQFFYNQLQSSTCQIGKLPRQATTMTHCRLLAMLCYST